MSAEAERSNLVLRVRGLVPSGQASDGAGLDFDVERGEAVALVPARHEELDPLLVDVLAGLAPPAAGEIAWQGVSSRDLHSTCGSRKTFRLRREQRIRTGYLSSSASLIHNQNIVQNVALPLVYHRNADPDEVEGRTNGLVASLELGEHAAKYPAELSRGVRRRAELARALVLDPPLVVLESPFAGIDRLSARILLDVLDEARSRGLAIVAAAPDVSELLRLPTRLLIVQGGRIDRSLRPAAPPAQELDAWIKRLEPTSQAKEPACARP